MKKLRWLLYKWGRYLTFWTLEKEKKKRKKKKKKEKRNIEVSKIFNFGNLKNSYFTCFIFFFRFTLRVSREKNILPRSRSREFLDPWSRRRSRSKKNTRSRSRSRLGKKSGAGAGAAWKKSQEPEPEPLKNLPAPQAC